MKQLKLWLSKIDTSAYIIAVIFALRIFLERIKINDTDFFWHVKTGEWVWQHKTVPHFDVFSWLSHSEKLIWVAHEWLADVGMYLLHQIGGLTLISYTTFFLFTTLIILSIYYSKLQIRKIDYLDETGKGLLLIFISLIITVLWNKFDTPRPQILSFVLLVTNLILLEKKKNWWSVIVAVLGINLHGGFWPLFFGVNAYYLLPQKEWKPLLVIFAATFINPNGYQTFMYPFYGLMDNTMSTQIVEWLPVSLFKESSGMLLSFILLGMVLIPKKKIDLWNSLMIVVCSIQAIRGLRFILFMPLLVLPVFITFIDYERIYNWLHKSINKLPKIIVAEPKVVDEQINDEKLTTEQVVENKQSTASLLTIVNLFGIAICLAMSVGVVTKTIKLDGNIVSQQMPIAAVKYMKAHPETQYRLLNDYNIGGYLIYNDIETFVDGRSDPFTTTFNGKKGVLDDYTNNIHKLVASPKQFMKKYKIKNIIYAKNSRIYPYILDLPEKYEIIYEDKDWFIAKVKGD